MTLSPKTLTLLVLIALALDALLVFLWLVGRGRTRTRRGTTVHMDDVLRGILEGHARSLQRLEAAIRELGSQDMRLVDRLGRAVQRVGLIRYDAFEDVGGRLSFSCAMLDEHGSGVVVTSINGRQDTRVYAKPVVQGASDHNLSDEEVQAIQEALSEAREAVRAT